MIDEKSGATQVLTGLSHQTHKGNAYTVSLASVLNGFDIAAPLSFLFTTPNTNVEAHAQIHGCSNTPAILQIYEDTGVAAQFNVTDGTTVTSINKNRNSSNVSTMTVTHTPTITKAEAEALIHTRYAGKAGAHTSFEFVLKKNTAYLFRFLAIEDNNEGSLNLDWCEYEDREWSARIKE